MTTVILRMMAGKKSTTQDRSGNHRGGLIAEIQVAVGMMVEDMTESQTKEADYLLVVVGMLTRMMLVDTTHSNPTPTIIYHQETEEEGLEEERAIEEVGNVVGGPEEEGVEEVEQTEVEERMILFEGAEAVTLIQSRVLSRSI
jgi:hypothetical protein